MRLRRFLLSFGLANLFFNGVEYAVTAQSETRPAVLSAEDMMRILPGNTLLAYDKSGPFWMYFPGPGTVWGQSSSGDVDIGHWWIDGDRYCRSWRVWYGGATQCWKLVTYGDNHLYWMDNSDSVQGESLIQQGNTIGTIRMPQLAAATVASDLDPVAETTIGPEPRMQSADGSSDHTASHSGSSSGQGGGNRGAGSSGGDPSGGSSSGGNSAGGSGASSGGGSSAGGSTGGGSSGDNSSGGGSAGGTGGEGGSSSGGGSSAAGGSSSGGNGGSSSSGDSGAGGNAGSNNSGSDQGGSVGGGGDSGKGGGKGHGAGKGQGQGRRQGRSRRE
jgi:hypothetical protein